MQRCEQMPMRACSCTSVLMFMLVKVRRIAAGATHASDNRGHTVAGHGRSGRAPAPPLPTRRHTCTLGSRGYYGQSCQHRPRRGSARPQAIQTLVVRTVGVRIGRASAAGGGREVRRTC